MIKIELSKKQLIRFIAETIDGYRYDKAITNGALIRLILDRVELAYRPLESWINEDGELDSIIELIEKMIN